MSKNDSGLMPRCRDCNREMLIEKRADILEDEEAMKGDDLVTYHIRYPGIFRYYGICEYCMVDRELTADEMWKVDAVLEMSLKQ